MPDPRKRDPRFPDRPTHQDFIDLSEAIQELDGRADEGVESFEDIMGVDPASLRYIMDARVGMALDNSGVTPVLAPLLKSVYMDAFTLGKRFAERRAE